MAALWRRLLLLWLLLTAVVADEMKMKKKKKGKKKAASKQLLQVCMQPGDDVNAVAEALAEGADINIVDETSGQTPLMAASLRGKADIVELLLQEGADPSIGEKDGYTPVHGAGFQGRLEVMKVLAKYGLNINVFHSDGYAPLHRACWGRTDRHTQLVHYLIDEGHVDVNLPARDGRTCYEMSPNRNTKHLVKQLGAWERRKPQSDEL